MNAEIAERVTRIKLYLDRIRDDMRTRNAAQAMADTAELGFQAGQLYAAFRHLYEKDKSEKPEHEP